MGKSQPPSIPNSEFGDDEPTVIDGEFLLDETTPEVNERCVECGRVVFLDNADSAHWPLDRCLRRFDGMWHWCAKLRKSVTYMP